MSELDDTIGPVASYERNETEAHRLDRNYAELLQELRVVGTGVQVFFAFLLGIAFQQRFAAIDGFERVVYMVTLLTAALAVVLLVAPVVFHRIVFRRRQKDDLVRWAARFSLAGIVTLAISVLGCVLLIGTWVLSMTAGVVITVVLGVVIVGLWFVIPLPYRYDHDVQLDPIERIRP